MYDPTIEDEKDHEVYCACNAGWSNICPEYPDSLCVIEADGRCSNIGRIGGERQHTKKVILILHPEYDIMTEKRRRATPDDAVVAEQLGIHKQRFCPRCKRAYCIVTEYEHGDYIYGNGQRQEGRPSNAADPELIANEIAQGRTKSQYDREHEIRRL
jgi:hypothetical protein